MDLAAGLDITIAQILALDELLYRLSLGAWSHSEVPNATLLTSSLKASKQSSTNSLTRMRILVA